MFSFDKFFGHVFSGSNPTRKNRLPPKRSLHLEPLEERQLLSVSQYDEELFGPLDFDEREHIDPISYDHDDALFFEEEVMPCPDAGCIANRSSFVITA